MTEQNQPRTMRLTERALDMAVEAGIHLLDPDSDLLEVFRKHAEGILILRQILIGLDQGQLRISSSEQQAQPATAKPQTAKNSSEAKTRSQRLAPAQKASQEVIEDVARTKKK